jgi:choice-of-anchor B domain-containing protein
MRRFVFAAAILVPTIVSAQTSLDTLRHLNVKPGGGYSAVWGYTAPNGREYALIGCNGSAGQQAGTSFVDITDNANVRQAGFTPGPASSWREMKTYRQYAYIVTEASGSGTQIVDLSYLPDSVHLVRTFVYTQGTNNTAKSHTITISDGFMYLNGCANWSPGGIVIFDLRTDPTNPTFVGTYEPEYIHDSYVLRDTIYGAAVYTGGGIHIANARNKASIQEIGKITYTGSGTHNAWVTKDRRFVISTDEIGSTQKTLKFWNISNLPTIPTSATTTYTPSPADIVHNITIRGDYAYVAWYTLGAVVVNVADPANPTYAGGYDTSTQPPGGYNGMWGIYPYYPSGKIVGGDMQNGLWVFRFSDLAARVPVTLLAPAMNETTVVASPVTFRWTKTADLNKDPHWYEVRLSGTGIDTTWRANDSLTTFSDLARLQSGRQYTWYVTVRDEFNTTQSGQTFQFTYGATPTAVNENEIPMTYALLQNYPNPFNPTTLIRYQIPAAAHVTMRLYNLIGQKVAELVNEAQVTGRYEVTLDASSLPSGIYFYRINAGSFTDTKKLTVLR